MKESLHSLPSQYRRVKTEESALKMRSRVELTSSIDSRMLLSSSLIGKSLCQCEHDPWRKLRFFATDSLEVLEQEGRSFIWNQKVLENFETPNTTDHVPHFRVLIGLHWKTPNFSNLIVLVGFPNTTSSSSLFSSRVLTIIWVYARVYNKSTC